jgi:hypothetical protein
MTPKEKAKELIDKCIPHTRLFFNDLGWTDCLDAAKCCAVIAVDEILKLELQEVYQNIDYWQKVKNEIEKIDKL